MEKEDKKIVYIATNLIDGKQYVGFTKNFKERLKRHKNRGLYFHNAIKKYGIENFKFIKIPCKSDKEMDNFEDFWVSELNTKAPNGYNLRTGGKKHFYHHNDSIKKMSEKKIGCLGPNKGKIFPKEWRNNISKGKLGTKMSEEFCKKTSKRQLGEGNSFFGKHHSTETLKTLQKINKGQHFSPKTEFTTENTIGKNNPMYGKSFYDIWFNKYGKECADKKLKLYKENKSIESAGKNNPMYGKSPYSNWIEKYGKEIADEKMRMCILKRNETRKRKKKNEYNLE